MALLLTSPVTANAEEAKSSLLRALSQGMSETPTKHQGVYVAILSAPGTGDDARMRARVLSWTEHLCSALSSKPEFDVTCAVDLKEHYLLSRNGRQVISADRGRSVEGMQAKLDAVEIVVAGEVRTVPDGRSIVEVWVGPWEPISETDTFFPRPRSITVVESLPPGETQANRIARLASRVVKACRSVQVPTTSRIGPKK